MGFGVIGSVLLLSFSTADAAGFLQNLRSQAFVGAGYKSKVFCSGVFVEGKTASAVLGEDFLSADSRLQRIQVGSNRRDTAWAGVFRTARSSQYLGPRLGCVLNDGKRLPYQVTYQGAYAPNALKTNIDPLLQARVLSLFGAERWRRGQRTEAFLVLRDGQIIAEAYRAGTRPDQTLHGWSLSKSVTHALVGRAVAMGLVGRPENTRVQTRGGVEIPLRNLLEMNSGLHFHEDNSSSFSDSTRMYFAQSDIAAYAANKPLIHPIGRHWSYSSGSSSLASLALRRAFARHQDYLDFPHAEFFSRVMPSAVFEIDPQGTYVAGGGVFATARDWAQFGQLYLDRGRLGGRDFLPSGWTDWACRPNSSTLHGQYGAGFWTNGFENSPHRPWPKLPADACSGVGYLGQMVLIVPSLRLVVVRLAGDSFDGAWTPNEASALGLDPG